MSDKRASLLDRYRPWQRQAEAGFWILVLGLEVLFNSITLWIDLNRGPRPLAFWQPLVWEITSTLVVGLLIPAVLAVDRRFSLRPGCLRRHALWHLGASVVFSVVHVLAMVLLRQFVYAAVGLNYEVGNWVTVLVYEYLKDLRSYAMILTAFYSYRFILLRLQGEARVLDAPEPPDGDAPAQDAAGPARPERFLVRKLRREFLIAANDIEWLQALGNSVGLHGDARLQMKGGTREPCSRRYRDALGPAR